MGMRGKKYYPDLNYDVATDKRAPSGFLGKLKFSFIIIIRIKTRSI